MQQLFEQAWVDGQYNLRARHPDAQQYFDRWTRESERVRAALPGKLDIAYGESAAETLDYFPAAASAAEGGAAKGRGAPVLIFIHGGYWRALDKKEHRFLAEPFVGAGCAFVNVNYALAPAVGIEEIVRQCRRAVGWTYRHCAGWGGDPNRLHVAGHSAGGHLTAMMLATDWSRESLPANALKGGCAISGVFELEPLRHSYLQGDLRLTEESAQLLSPLLHLPKRGPPLIVAVGAEETEEFLRQSEAYAVAWRGQGLPVQHRVVPGCHHFSILEELANPASPLLLSVREQLLGR